VPHLNAFSNSLQTGPFLMVFSFRLEPLIAPVQRPTLKSGPPVVGRRQGHLGHSWNAPNSFFPCSFLSFMVMATFFFFFFLFFFDFSLRGTFFFPPWWDILFSQLRGPGREAPCRAADISFYRSPWRVKTLSFYFPLEIIVTLVCLLQTPPPKFGGVRRVHIDRHSWPSLADFLFF